MLNASRESWDEYRDRVLKETSRFIEWGLEHPEEVIEIPSKPAENGGFPAKMSQWFWGIVLSERKDSWILRWRDFLRRRPKLVLRGPATRLRPSTSSGRAAFGSEAEPQAQARRDALEVRERSSE